MAYANLFKKFFLPTLLVNFVLLSPLCAQSVTGPLKVKSTKQDGTIVFERLPGPPPWAGVVIQPLGENPVLIKLKVLKCNKTLCMSKLQKTEDVGIFKPDQAYRMTYIKRLTEVTKEPLKKHLAYLGYGSPQGPALKLGYGQKLTDFLVVGGTYSAVGSKTKEVQLKGSLLTGFARAELIPVTDNLVLYLVFEAGLSSSQLTFTANGNHEEQKGTTYLGSVASEAAYRIGDFALSLKMGFSKSGLKEDYTYSSGKYSNPYGKLLAFVETGLYYEF